MGKVVEGPSTVNVRFKIGIIEVDDVKQQFVPDVNIFYYFTPTWEVSGAGFHKGVRFENLHKKLPWHPHFDFNFEVEEQLVTDESYWYDKETNRIFGRINILPRIQDRFDHNRFPFDRQILDLQLMSNNTLLKQWDVDEFPVELSLQNKSWMIQCELNAVADTWDLVDVVCQIANDKSALSSVAHFQVFLERDSKFYIWNIGVVYFLILMAQATMFVFPYNETRFDFAMQLALTTVAFKFVTEMHVPKCGYLTTLDKYMLWGLILLAFRFLGDTIIQYAFDVPIGEEGARGKCDEDIYGPLDPCTLDQYLTIALSSLWFLSSMWYLGLAQHMLRPSWKSLNRIDQHGNSQSRIQYEVKGKTDITIQNRKLNYMDLQNSVDIEASNKELVASLETASVEPDDMA